MSFLTGENIRQLQNLFRPPGDVDGSDSEDDGGDVSKGNKGVQQLGPGDIGAPKAAKSKKKPNENPDEHMKSCSYAPVENPEPTQPQTIEEWEKQQDLESETLLESRPAPEYKLTYKQTVGTEDLYLHMSAKTPSTASCESMVIEIFLRGETVGIQHIDLAVQEQRIVVKSPKYYLNLQLPHRIDPDKGNAAWLSEEKILKLTLKMEREYDFVNF